MTGPPVQHQQGRARAAAAPAVPSPGGGWLGGDQHDRDDDRGHEQHQGLRGAGAEAAGGGQHVAFDRDRDEQQAGQRTSHRGQRLTKAQPHGGLIPHPATPPRSPAPPASRFNQLPRARAAAMGAWRCAVSGHSPLASVCWLAAVAFVALPSRPCAGCGEQQRSWGCRRLSAHPALVAQRIEHLTTDQKVGGSSPSERAIKHQVSRPDISSSERLPVPFGLILAVQASCPRRRAGRRSGPCRRGRGGRTGRGSW